MKSIAKINLFLKIVRKREDGYHELETVFFPLPWLADDVNVSVSDRMGITCDGNCSGVPADERNLCWKAACMFQETFGVTTPVKIHVTKRIPVAAGLGGGSSNAASTLLEMRRIFRPELPTGELAPLAARLGADVAFFLLPAVPAFATGIGEILTTLSCPVEPPPIIIVNPSFPISAAWSYAHWKETCQPAQKEAQFIIDTLANGNWNEIEYNIHNDLEYCAFAKFPLLQMVKSRMESLGIRNVHITGSGPTLFGFMNDDKTEQQNIVKTLQAEFTMLNINCAQ